MTRPRTWRTPALCLIGLLLVGGLGGASVVGSTIELAPLTTPSLTPPSTPRVAVCYNSVDNEYAVFCCGGAGLTGTGNELTLRRFDAATGAPIGEAVSNGHHGYFPAIAHAPTVNRYMVAWLQSREDVSNPGGLAVQCFEHDFVNVWNKMAGVATYMETAPAGANPSSPSIIFNGTHCVLVYDTSGPLWRSAGVTSDVECQFWDVDRKPPTGNNNTSTEFTIAGNSRIEIGTSDGRHPSIAWLGGDDTTCLVTWAEDKGGVEPRSIMARTIAEPFINGYAQMGPVMTLSAPPAPGSNNDWPRVAANPSSGEWLVAWEKNDQVDSWAGRTPGGATVTVGDIAFRRVDATGAPMGGAEVTLQGASTIDLAPAVGWVENAFLVAWQRNARETGADLYVARIASGSDTVVQNNIPLARSGEEDFYPCMTSINGPGDEVLIAWNTGVGSQVGARASRFSPYDLRQLAQVRLDATTPIPAGGSMRDTSFVAKAKLKNPAGRLQVEVKETGVAFTGAPTFTGYAAEDASATVTGLVRGTSYHWRARVLFPDDSTSEWSQFGSADDNEVDFALMINTPPTALSRIQIDPATGGTVAPGLKVLGGGIRIQAAWSDGEDDPESLEVEIRPMNESFTGIPTASSPLSGGGLSDFVVWLASDSYHWQARLNDGIGRITPWVAFGGNPETSIDFTLLPEGSTAGAACFGGATGVTGAALPLAALLLALAGVVRR